MKKSLAFTLAEVMLTMTIVGVVAAMTIPTLHYQRVKKEYSAKLKNFYSRMENAILDMEIDHGSFKNLPQPAMGDTDGGFEFYLKYIDPYLGHAYVDKNKHVVYYRDGSSFGVSYVGQFLEFWYDVNGDKAPNKSGFDRYMFLYGFTDQWRESCYGNPNTFFGPYCPRGEAITGVSRETLIQKCRDGEDGTVYSSGAWCTKLLQVDQWEFKDDYPLKF